MEFKHIADKFYYLGGPIFSFYITDGERQTLIELGISQIVPHLVKAAQKHLGRFEPAYLIGLHSHFDHIGGAVRLKEMFPTAQLAASAHTDKIMRDPDTTITYVETMEKINSNPMLKMVYQDVDEAVIFYPLGLDIILREGDGVPLDDAGKLQVLETPGHTECSISLFHQPTKTLFVSDACGVPFPSGRIWPTAFYDLALYKKNMQRMLNLEPHFLCLAHVGFFKGEQARRYLERSLKVTDSFFNHIAELLQIIGSEKGVLKALMDEYENDIPFIQPFIFKYGCREMIKQVAKNHET
ncbi:MAG: MBL fold metallo-hydrolase [bacterium]